MVYMVTSLSSSEDCTTLARDNYIQKTLQTFEEEEEEPDDRTCTEYVVKYLDDMCGWIPDPTIQYRRHGSARTSKTSQKAHGRTGGKTDWGNLSRRTGRNDNQGPALTEYEFKHYTNLKKYIEQYRRFHTCGGPLEKLSQSAYGRTKTIYYTNESGASDKQATTQSKSTESEERRPQTRPESRHRLPDPPRGSLVRNYHEPSPSTAPRYHSLTDSVLRKRTVSSQHNAVIGNYTNNGWSNVPQGVVCGEPPPQKPNNSNKETPMQWTINEHGLTVYHEKSPASVFRHKAAADAISGSPFAAYAPTQGSFLPFFTPSQHVMATAGIQQKRKQLDISPPPNVPNNLPVSNGFSIDRTIGSKSCTTGATPNKNKTCQDFYSQLVHAAINLQLTKNKKPISTTHVQKNNLQRMIQNKLNLSPTRQNPRPNSSKSRHSTRSNKSYHSHDSASTCSSQRSDASRKPGSRRRTDVKPQHERLTQLQKDSVSSATSSLTSFGTTDSTAAQDTSSRTSSGTKKAPLTVSLDIGRLPSAQSCSLVKLNGSGDGVPTAFRLSLQEQNEKILGESNDRRLAVCEATWF